MFIQLTHLTTNQEYTSEEGYTWIIVQTPIKVAASHIVAVVPGLFYDGSDTPQDKTLVITSVPEVEFIVDETIDEVIALITP